MQCLKIYLKLYMNSFELPIINLELPIINLKPIHDNLEIVMFNRELLLLVVLFIFQNKLTQCSLIRPLLSLFLVAPSISCEGMMTL